MKNDAAQSTQESAYSTEIQAVACFTPIQRMPVESTC
jgi:hypothetical protein